MVPPVAYFLYHYVKRRLDRGGKPAEHELAQLDLRARVVDVDPHQLASVIVVE